MTGVAFLVVVPCSCKVRVTTGGVLSNTMMGVSDVAALPGAGRAVSVALITMLLTRPPASVCSTSAVETVQVPAVTVGGAAVAMPLTVTVTPAMPLASLTVPLRVCGLVLTNKGLVRARRGAVPSAMPVTVAVAGGTPTPVMDMVALLGPSAPTGRNFTSKLQFAPAARVAMPVGQGNTAEGTIVKSGLTTTGLLAGTFAAITGVNATPARLLILIVFNTPPTGLATPKLVAGGAISRPTVWPVIILSPGIGPLVLPRGSITVKLLGPPAGAPVKPIAAAPK